MSRHVCPVVRCEVLVPDRLFLCPHHWHQVSRDLQHRVYAAYRRGLGVGTPALAEAQAAALAHVNAQILRGGRA